ncbi:MAG: hypothetical protein Q8Q25_00460 [bacterium]|nr:hypothetical protein [bacterium]
MKKLTYTLITALIAAGVCQSIEARRRYNDDDDKKTERTVLGGVVGGGAGAGIGYAAGGPVGAGVGAGVGLVTGGVIGSRWGDRTPTYKELRDENADLRVEIRNLGAQPVQLDRKRGRPTKNELFDENDALHNQLMQLKQGRQGMQPRGMQRTHPMQPARGMQPVEQTQSSESY